MFRLVVFDLDGTLFDSAGAILEALNLTFAEIGLGPYDWDRDIARFFGKPFSLWAEALLKDGGKYSEANVKRMVERMFENYTVIGPKHSKLSPGAIEALEGLKSRGVRLAVATNMIKRHMDAFFTRFGLANYFGGVCTASDVSKEKPDPDQMECILKRVDAARDEILMVGDSETDVLFARNCGVKVALLDAPWNKRLRPDYRLGNLKELLGIVR
jgi:phosphoglycolate phosphatase